MAAATKEKKESGIFENPMIKMAFASVRPALWKMLAESGSKLVLTPTGNYDNQQIKVSRFYQDSQGQPVEEKLMDL